MRAGLCEQCVNDVVSAKYLVSDTAAVFLAAVQLQVQLERQRVSV